MNQQELYDLVNRRPYIVGLILLVGMALGVVVGLSLPRSAETVRSVGPREAAQDSVRVGADAAPAQTLSREFPPLAALQPPPVPADNQLTDARIALGRLLFFDPRISGDGNTSCSSCHNPALGWGNGTPISFGGTGTLHWRNSSTILNSAYYTHLNWDGSAKSLENQANGAWRGAVAGNVDVLMAEERLAQMPDYVALFEAAYGTAPNWENMLRAVGAFQSTIVSDPANVPFDRFLNGDDSALSEEALRGLELFEGAAGCIACHNGPLVSDQNFYNLGVPQPEAWADNPVQQITFRYEQWAKGAPQEVYDVAVRDLGLFYVTHREEDVGFFRTPSLRELGHTAPYMHNGVFATLEQVVAFYNDGGGDDPGKDPRLTPLGLSEADQAALVAFLLTLTGDEPLMIEPPELPEYAVYDN